MKKFIILLFLTFNGYSQHKIEYDYINETSDSNGNAKTIYKCYLYTDNIQSKFIKDRVINGKLEQELRYPNPELEEKFKAEDKANVFGDSIGYVVTKFMKTDSVYLRNVVGTLLKENLHKDYTIIDDFKMIYNYKCQKASTKIYGKEFEIWFTTEIAINDGPWKLSGLPGLIIEVHSKDRFHNFYFTSIKKLSNNAYIYAPTPYKKIMNRELLVKSQIERAETDFKYRKSKRPDSKLKVTINDLDLPLIVFE